MNEERRINPDLAAKVENSELAGSLKEAPQIESLELKDIRPITNDITHATYYVRLKKGYSFEDLQNYISKRMDITGCGLYTFEENTYRSLNLGDPRVRIRVLSDYNIKPIELRDLII